MYILGVHTGHDAAACVFKNQQLIAFCKEERLSRIKNDGRKFDLAAIDHVLNIAGIARKDLEAVCFTRMRFPIECYRRSSSPLKDLKRKILKTKRDRYLTSEMTKRNIADESKILDFDKLRKYMSLSPDTQIHFTNHHLSHVLSSLMYSPWSKETLLVSCDGGGDGAQYSAYFFNGNQLKTIWGAEEKDNPAASIGLAYAYATKNIGFIPNRHEGKLTGLAAFGKPVALDAILAHFTITDEGKITSDLSGKSELENRLANIFSGLSREDVSASIQIATETLVQEWVRKLAAMNPTRNIAMSGGVFSNVRLNQRIAEIDGIEEVFIFPAMGDEGLPVGNCVNYLIENSGLNKLQRTRLQDAFFGHPYTGQDLIDCAQGKNFIIERTDNPAVVSAKLLAEGQTGAIFHGAMEMGPRALGARSILASPEKREVNDSINKRLQRTEFMPFAPFVLPEDARAVFDIDDCNEYACRFMTITTDVKDEWREKIPAVVHVDGTARPQIIERKDNWLYHDTLLEFKKISGLPCLVNTSFNAHEEPIINTPDEALTALADDRIDFLVCDKGLIFRS